MRPLKLFFYNLRTQKKGYLTIEASIVFSAVFCSLIIILFMGMVLYQEVNLQSLAVRTSERGSVIYSSRVTDMKTGVKTLDDFTHRDPYRNVPFIDGGNKEDYKNLLNSYVAGNVGQFNVISGEIQNRGNYVTVEDYLIAKRVKVNSKGGYQMPADSIAKMFGREGPFVVNTTATSAVMDSPDFVRNVDLAMDVVKQTSVFGRVEEGYNKIRDALDKVLNLLK